MVGSAALHQIHFFTQLAAVIQYRSVSARRHQRHAHTDQADLVLVASKIGAGGTVLEGSEHEGREVKITGILRKARIRPY
ncbi:MAG TPA: hypothetical protein VLM19_07545 [Nitrospiraceae bacterium]|nr:hypothetical protein [Nitrospiraceae bacterium]